MISDSSFHGADVRFRALITKSDTLSYEGLAFLYRLFTQRGPSHNQNPIFTTETRRHGDTEKSRGENKVKSKYRIKTREQPRTQRIAKKIAQRGRAATKIQHSSRRREGTESRRKIGGKESQSKSKIEHRQQPRTQRKVQGRMEIDENHVKREDCKSQ